MTESIPNLKNKDALELKTRKDIYEVVKRFAGCHFKEIVRKSKLSNGSVSYHLHYLVKHNLIKQEKKDNSVFYFPIDFKSENSKILSLLRQRSMRNIILFIIVNSGCEHRQIVNFTNLSPSTVTWYLKKLEEEKIIIVTKKGRTKNYKLLIKREDVINLLITYKESFLDSLVDNIIETWDIT